MSAVKELFDEIDDRVNELEIQSGKLRAHKSMACLNLASLCIGLILGHQPELEGTTIMGMLAGANLVGLLKSYSDLHGEKCTLRKSEYFIPFAARSNLK